MPEEASNPPTVSEARANYEKRKKQLAHFRRRWVKLKHRTRKAKHRIAKAIDRRKAAQAGHKENEIRDAIVDYALWGCANEPSIHYSQTRPFPINALKTLPMYTDCSGFATMACKAGGAEDPNGLGFNGSGYTGTLYSHCPKISQSRAKPGDLLEHGGSPGSHVNVLVESGSKSDPMVVSHGQESGPRQYPASTEIAAHAGQAAYWLQTVN